MQQKMSLILPYEFEIVFQSLPLAEAGRLVLAIYAYEQRNEVPNFSDNPMLQFAWGTHIKPKIDENIEKYNAVCEARRSSGSKGGKATQEKQKQSNQANASFGKQNNQKEANQADYDYDYDCDNDCDNDCDGKEKINKKEKQRTTSAVVVAKKLISDFAGDDKDLEAALNDFLSMRKKIKKPLTDRALQQRLKKLQELSGGDQQKAAAIVDQTVNHCWQDFYPLKDGNDKNMTAQETDDKATEILESGEIDGIFD